MSYSEKQLSKLAQDNPKELARILTDRNADIATLTFGVEILGEEVSDEAIVLPVFKQLLKHINAIVREGAIIGVAAFYANKSPPQDIFDRLRIMSNNDPSAAVKEVAKGVVEDFNTNMQDSTNND